ncbi:TPA: hypothetical protein ACNEJR_003646 [Escherichia coli]
MLFLGNLQGQSLDLRTNKDSRERLPLQLEAVPMYQYINVLWHDPVISAVIAGLILMMIERKR